MIPAALAARLLAGLLLLWFAVGVFDRRRIRKGKMRMKILALLLCFAIVQVSLAVADDVNAARIQFQLLALAPLAHEPSALE
jgi:hypothetical protein